MIKPYKIILWTVFAFDLILLSVAVALVLT